MIVLQFAVLPLTLSLAGTIPWGVDHDSGIPVVSITTGSLPSSLHKLYMGDRIIKHVSDQVPEDRRSEHVEEFNAESDFDRSAVSPLVFRRLEIEVQSDERSRRDWLGIGPMSELVEAHASVDYFSNRTELVLGSSEESFTARCLPESVARVLIGADLGMPDISAVGAIETAANRFEGIFRFSPIDVILEIGQRTFNELFADLISQGLLDHSRLAVSSLDALDRFRNITLAFHNDSLVLSPVDYIDVNTGGLRIRPYELYDQPIIHFNPLLIPNINVRSSNLGLLIGKSINQRGEHRPTPSGEHIPTPSSPPPRHRVNPSPLPESKKKSRPGHHEEDN